VNWPRSFLHLQHSDSYLQLGSRTSLKIITPSAAALTLALTLAIQASWFPNSGRYEYYPSEEAAERSSIVWPRLVELHAGGAGLEWPDKSSKVLGVGDRYREFKLVAIVPQAAPMAVLERDFSHWGILAYIFIPLP